MTYAVFGRKSLHIALLVAGLSACSAGPDYVKPELSLPTSYKYEAGWQTVTPQSWAAQGEWWRAFNDPALDSLINQAMQANQTLAQAEARYRAAQAQLRGAKSDYFPLLDGGVSASRSGGDNSPLQEGYSAGLSLSWAPDLWGRVRRQVESERASLQSSSADLVAVQLALQLAVAQSYIRLRAYDLQREILEQTVVAYDRSYTLTNNQYKAGIVARSDVIQAETQRQSLKADMIALKFQRALEENNIAVLLGKAPVTFSLSPRLSLPEVPALPEVLPSTLLARRPDVVAAERQLAAANAQIGVAKTAWLPSFGISASQGVQAAQFSELLDAPSMFWSVGPSLAQILFDGGARKAIYELAKAQYDEQLAFYRQTVLDSLAEVENALASISLLSEQAVQQNTLVELAEENERIINNRYRAGIVSFLEVATAQNLTLSAKRARLSNTAERLQAALQLAAVIGGGWELDDPVVQTVNVAKSEDEKPAL